MRALIILVTTAVAYIVMSSYEAKKKKEKESDEFLRKLGVAIDKTGILVYASGIGIAVSVIVTSDTGKIAIWFALPITMWTIATVLSLIYDIEKESQKEKQLSKQTKHSNHKVKEIFKSRDWRKAMIEEMYKPKGERYEIHKRKCKEAKRNWHSVGND